MPIASRMSGTGRASATVSICPDSPSVEMRKFLVRARKLINGDPRFATIPAGSHEERKPPNPAALGPEHGAGRNREQQELGIERPMIGYQAW